MLSVNLKNLRTNKKMSQKDLAKFMNVSQQTIGSWEVGRAEPDTKNLIKLADFFNVTTDYLLGKKETNSNKINDLDDMSTLMMFEGRPIPEEDKETVKAVLRSLRQRREEMDRKNHDK